MTKDCAYANCLDVDDDWFNEQLPKPGDMCFVTLDPLAEHGDRYSALELSINKIYSSRAHVSLSISARNLRQPPRGENIII